MAQIDDQVEQTDPEQEWVNKYQAMPYKELAARMLELREVKALADNAAKAAGKELEVIEIRVIPPRLEAEGLKNVTIAGVGRIGLRDEMYCNQKPGMQDGLFEFLRENEYGDLIKDTVNASSLKSLVKELLADHAASLANESSEGADLNSMLTEAGVDSAYTKISQFLNITPFKRASITKR